MGSRAFQVVILATLCIGGTGCMSTPDARYVYQDGQYGVIGIPRNTSLGKKDFRAQAHELMIKHFPEGYEIVRAEEVVEGERVLDTARKVEVDTEPAVAALNQMIRIGKLNKVESLDQKDSLKITESRIIYRRKPEGPTAGKDGFANLATLAPDLYIDPNQIVRKELKEGTYLAKKEAPKVEAKETKTVEAKVTETKTDTSVERASTTGPK